MAVPAALEALPATRELYARDNIQALIDRRVIVGLSVLVRPPWKPPSPWGSRCGCWKLPNNLNWTKLVKQKAVSDAVPGGGP